MKKTFSFCMFMNLLPKLDITNKIHHNNVNAYLLYVHYTCIVLNTIQFHAVLNAYNVVETITVQNVHTLFSM